MFCIVTYCTSRPSTNWKGVCRLRQNGSLWSRFRVFSSKAAERSQKKKTNVIRERPFISVQLAVCKQRLIEVRRKPCFLRHQFFSEAMTRAIHLTLFFLGWRLVVLRGEDFTEAVQNKILEIIALFAIRSAPVIISTNCELDTDFRAKLVASHLSFTYAASGKAEKTEESILAGYAKTLLTPSDRDRFYLGFHCSIKADKLSRGPLNRLFTRKNWYTLLAAGIPSHSFAFLWITDIRGLWDSHKNRMVTSHTQIYCFWDDKTNKLALYSTKAAVEKWYSHFLAMYFSPDGRLDRLDLRSLKFGRASVQNLQVDRVTVSQSTELFTTVELSDPKGANVSLSVQFESSLVRFWSSPMHLVRFTSYHSYVAVARVPSISKNTQVARSMVRVQIWLPITLSALVVALVLRFVKENFGSMFIRLLAYVVFPVSFDSHGKPKQFLIIVGTWIFVLQVIVFGFKGDIVASIQALPEGRIESINNCEQFPPEGALKKSVGYIVGDDLFTFFNHELPNIVKGTVICKNTKGFGSLRESLLSNVPMYTLHTLDTVVENIILMPKNTNYFGMKTSLTQRTAVGICCVRLAQLGLTHALYHPRYVVKQQDKKTFQSELDRVMGLKLSPTYHTERCLSYEKVESSLLTQAVVMKTPRRCFVWEDLHPNTEHAMYFDDIVFTLQISAVLISISVVCFLLESLHRTRITSRIARRLNM